ncbi:MAG: amidohydrolase family protein, partial [Acidimicrobiales bacterium]
MGGEREAPNAFARRVAPEFVVAGGRVLRRWRAKGPRLGNYAPVSTLELPAHVPQKACMPAVNFHTHLGRWLTRDGAWMEPDVGKLLGLMDVCNIESSVNLDGRWGRELEENLDRYDRAHPGRFFTFCHVDWALLERRDGPGLLAESLRSSVKAGARGLKVWKDLG